MKKHVSTLLGLVLLTACGGGGGGGTNQPSPSPMATALAYTDPVASGPRLVRNPTLSNGSLLVLEFIGPSNTQVRGLALTLTTDATKVEWVPPVDDGSFRLVQELEVIPLGTAPQLRFESRDPLNRGSLDLGLFQKGGGPTLVGDRPLFRLALRLGASTPKGTISLALTPGRQLEVADSNGTLNTYALSVGTLRAD